MNSQSMELSLHFMALARKANLYSGFAPFHKTVPCLSQPNRLSLGLTVRGGVPQCIAFGPLIFLTSVNDITSTCNKAGLMLSFAGDTKTGGVSKERDLIQYSLNATSGFWKDLQLMCADSVKFYTTELTVLITSALHLKSERP